MMVRAALLAALLGALVVPSAESQTTTTAPDVYINIHVTLTNSKVIVSPTTAPRGADARFIVRNIGTKPLSFTLRTGATTGFTRVFKPGKPSILLLYLAFRGSMAYYGGASSASAKPGMKGTLVIGQACALCIQDN